MLHDLADHRLLKLLRELPSCHPKLQFRSASTIVEVLSEKRRAGQTKRAAGQDTLFDLWRFHAFFTTADPAILDTVAADKTHRHHAVIEQVHADLKNSALAHLPSGVFTANAAWLVLAVIAFNLTRAAGTLAAPDLARASTATIRRTLITVPARIASSARRITLHLPTSWPWQTPWTALFDRVNDPPPMLPA